MSLYLDRVLQTYANYLRRQVDACPTSLAGSLTMKLASANNLSMEAVEETQTDSLRRKTVSVPAGLRA